MIANTGAANSTGTTFQAGDVLNGGTGTDTLNISVAGGNAGTNAAVTLNGIEKVLVSNVNAATQSISLSLADASLTTVGHSSSNTGAVTTFSGLKKIVDAELSNGDAGITLSYNATVVAGTADSQNLTLSNQTGGTFTANGVETLNVASTVSDNTLALAAGPTTVNVTGAAKLTLGTLDAGITKLDASANTGGVVATMSATATTAITASAGNDTITTGTTLSGVGAVNAGAGTDTLVLTADTVIAAAADGARYTNFETLSVLNSAVATTARTQDVSLVAGVTALNATMKDTSTATGADTTMGVTFSNVSATANTLNITGLSSAETVAGVDVTATVTATRQLNTSADAMTVNLGTATAASGATQTAVSGAGNGVILNVSLANEESITINSLGGANFIGALTNTAATAVTLTGSRALSFGSMTSTVVKTIDASAMTANFIMGTNAGGVASTISGGTGNDTLTGGSAADNMAGGAGNDSITAAAGNDVVAAGDGNDTVNAGAGVDSVDGGLGNDTIQITTVGDFLGLAAAETVIGGAGNDTLSIDTSGANVAITIAAADLAAISGIETLSINGGTAAGSVTLTDAVFTANGATTLAIVDGLLTGNTTGTLTVNASALTAANSVTVTANTVTGNNDNLTGGAGADTFKFSTVAGLEATDTVVGGTGTDTIELSATTAAVTAVLTGVSGVERVVSTGTAGDVTITLGADTVIAASGTLTTDASSVTNGAFKLTYNGSAVNTATKAQNVTGTIGDDVITGGSGNDVIVGADGNDSITGGAGTDNLSGGNGNDTFAVATTGTGFTGLTIAETVSGGAGNDTLQFAAGILSVAASDLVNTTGIETVEIQNTGETASLTLTDAFFASNGNAALAVNASTMDTGVLTLSASTLSTANSVQLNLSNVANNAANVINLGAGNDTVTADMIALDTGTIAGGAGTDTLTISANTGGGAITAVAAMTGFETINFATAGVAGTFNLITNDANVAAAATQTVNGSNVTGTLTFNGAAELDGKFSITGGSGADALTGGALADTISGGAGDDVITGGNGADSLVGGLGVDTFVYAAVAQSNSVNVDTVTDWTSGTDKLRVTLDYSAQVVALDVNATRVSAGVAGTSAAQDLLSGQRGQYVYDTSSSSLFVNFNSDNLLTSADYKIGLAAASTASATVVDGDVNFVITGGTNADVITAGGGADTINGGAGADSITGGAGADSITAGTGADTLVGGSGADTIVLGAANDADVVVYSQAAAADGGSTAATADTITGFVTAEDKLSITGALKTAVDLTGAGAVTNAKTSTGAAGNVATAADTELLFAVTAFSALATANFGDMAAVATAANAMFNFGTGPTGPVLMLFAGGAVTAHALYLYTETGAYGDNSASAAEIKLLGVITSDAALAATDLNFI